MNGLCAQYLRMYTQMAGFNVLMFNYRGVSESGGVLTQPGTVLDGEAMLEVWGACGGGMYRGACTEGALCSMARPCWRCERG